MPAYKVACKEGAENPKSGQDSSDTVSLKKVNQLLWKAEVDLENVEDMHKRYL